MRSPSDTWPKKRLHLPGARAKLRMFPMSKLTAKALKICSVGCRVWIRPAGLSDTSQPEALTTSSMMWRPIFEEETRRQNFMHAIRNFRINLKLLAGCLLVSAVCIIPARAQNTRGVKGKVQNLNGAGIAGVAISARQKGIDLKTATSDGKGNFVLDGLEPGIYNLAFEAKGYSTAVKYDVEIKRGKSRDLGDRLILMIDRGSRVLIKGSVFFKEGASAAGATVELEKVNVDG